MELNVLLVEDDPKDLEQYTRDLPDVFKANGIDVTIDAMSKFEDAYDAIKNPHIRYDLVISDTYRGDHKNHDAAVMDMIAEYKKGKFCPIIVYSSGTCPAELESTAFVNWVGKIDFKDITNAITEILDLGVPQLAKNLHDEIDNAAGSYLWTFLEDNWQRLTSESNIDSNSLERLIRRRAALKISDLTPGSETFTAVTNRHGLEYYIYPSLEHDYFSLGDIIINKEDKNNIRVIMTPHCHLFIQQGQQQPRADYVLTIKTISAEEILGEKLMHAKDMGEEDQNKKLKKWANSPAQTDKKPTGRHWYLPKFLDIPHLYCDFLQIESIKYNELNNTYKKIATLLPPYAEALQECFSSFYGSVGIPKIDPNSIKDLIPD